MDKDDVRREFYICNLHVSKRKIDIYRMSRIQTRKTIYDHFRENDTNDYYTVKS